MNQQAASLDQLGPDPSDSSRSPSLRPLGPLWLSVGLVGIVVAALAVCCLVALIAILVLTVKLGVEGRIEFLQDLRFDFPLKLRLGAIGVGIFYAGAAAATVAAATIVAALPRGGRSWSEVLALGPPRRDKRRMAVLVVAALVYAALSTTTVEYLRTRPLIISGPTDFILVGMIAVNLVLLAPIAEELVFRGWLYTGLRARFGFWPSFLVTTIAFASIHWDSHHRRILLVLPLAVTLGLLREVAGSIRPTILLHACYNLIIVVITLAATL